MDEQASTERAQRDALRAEIARLQEALAHAERRLVAYQDDEEDFVAEVEMARAQRWTLFVIALVFAIGAMMYGCAGRP